jgi:hypothetical protein
MAFLAADFHGFESVFAARVTRDALRTMPAL